jgi:hypothetical protein
MDKYQAPRVAELGTLEELTEVSHKPVGSGDYIISNANPASFSASS